MGINVSKWCQTLSVFVPILQMKRLSLRSETYVSGHSVESTHIYKEQVSGSEPGAPLGSLSPSHRESWSPGTHGTQGTLQILCL